MVRDQNTMGRTCVYANMKVQVLIISSILTLLGLCSCNHEDDFSRSPNDLLSFSVDSVKLDTVFSNIPSSVSSFWVYNYSGKDIRCTSVRLERGNQTGFRVNVDGVYLGQEVGFQASDIEIRKQDSIRVYVELTSPYGYTDAVREIHDRIIFTLESGKEQKVGLNALSWDGIVLKDFHISKDTTFSGEKPIIIYGGLTVDSAKTLTIAPGTTLYFHHDAGIDVYGRLIAEGSADKNIVLRGSRLDRMFDYLPYNRVSGQWRGIRFRGSSYDNLLTYADIHGACDGVVLDSADVARQTLTITASNIHNCQGYGLLVRYARIGLFNSLFSNALNDCVAIQGGYATINGCTVAQFYPFDSKRGVALRLGSRENSVHRFECINTIVTGYADDELMRVPGDETRELNFLFDHCLLRTPRELTADSIRFAHVVYEAVRDTAHAGYKNFINIDQDSLKYDFRLAPRSLAIDKANTATALAADRSGRRRDAKPDIGAYEYIKEE